MNSTHPIAGSILQAAKDRGAGIVRAKSMEEISGHGIKAVIAGKQVLCGNKKLLEREQILVEEPEEISSKTLVYVSVDGECAGCILISDTIKENAPSAVKELKKRRIVTAMLTGDAKSSADAVARETGIEKVYAKLLPEDKLEHLQSIRKECGSVMFVGDGINDAPVLAGADVGAAMGSGADAAIEAADVVFMTSDMNAIVQSIDIAGRTCRIAKQNVVFALVIKFAIMILGIFGFANMWLAVFADTGVAILCILNSIRILYARH
jgi:Cd2+/Zn2+-exporting ATPase